MAWTIEFSEVARKRLRKTDKQVARRIVKAVEDIARLDDPRIRGKPLTGRFSGLWRYRVGDWRVIATLEYDRLVVVVVDAAHRSEVYD